MCRKIATICGVSLLAAVSVSTVLYTSNSNAQHGRATTHAYVLQTMDELCHRLDALACSIVKQVTGFISRSSFLYSLLEPLIRRQDTGVPFLLTDRSRK
jgi:hypothetical protein